MKLVIPAYGRHELTRRVRAYYERMEAPVVIGESRDEDGNTSGAEDFICRNHPLGWKFNRVIRGATNKEGSVMMCGSDALLSQAHVESAELLYGQADLVLVQGCHFFNSATGEMVYVHRFQCGSGVYMSSALLDRCGYNPYDNKAREGVDRGPKSYAKTSAIFRAWAGPQRPICVEVRTENNMWSWEWVQERNGAEAVDADVVFARLGENKEDWMGL